MSFQESMYKVVLAERDYERQINQILRNNLESVRHDRGDLILQNQVLRENNRLLMQQLEELQTSYDQNVPEMCHGHSSV